jgi:hypothetical protein
MTTEKDPASPTQTPTIGRRISGGVSIGLNFLGKVFSHPVTTLVSRVVAVGLASSSPPLLGAIIAAQAVSISFRTAQAYRKRSLVLREDLLKKLEEIDKEKQQLLKKLGVPPRAKENRTEIQYEKSPRKDVKPGLIQSIGTTIMEDVVPIVSDMISTHGVSLVPRVLKILNDTWMTVVSWFGGKKEGGALSQRAQEIIENDERRDRIQKLAAALDVPDYKRDPEILRKYIEKEYRELKALRTIDAQGETYSSALFNMYTEQASSKDQPLLSTNAKFSLFRSSLREAVVGNKEDYAYITEAWSSIKNLFKKPTIPSLSVETNPIAHEITKAATREISAAIEHDPHPLASERPATLEPSPSAIVHSEPAAETIEQPTVVRQPISSKSKKMEQAERRLLGELKKATVTRLKVPELKRSRILTRPIKRSRDIEVD